MSRRPGDHHHTEGTGPERLTREDALTGLGYPLPEKRQEGTSSRYAVAGIIMLTLILGVLLVRF